VKPDPTTVVAAVLVAASLGLTGHICWLLGHTAGYKSGVDDVLYAWTQTTKAIIRRELSDD
jgi:hypothetical protein